MFIFAYFHAFKYSAQYKICVRSYELSTTFQHKYCKILSSAQHKFCESTKREKYQTAYIFFATQRQKLFTEIFPFKTTRKWYFRSEIRKVKCRVRMQELTLYTSDLQKRRGQKSKVITSFFSARPIFFPKLLRVLN